MASEQQSTVYVVRPPVTARAPVAHALSSVCNTDRQIEAHCSSACLRFAYSAVERDA